jgi:predicted SAM-dependent methyltransferase
MDGLKLSFRNEVIDRVLLIAVLHHFASEETRLKALKEIFRILSPRGLLYISVLSYENKGEIYSSP